MRLPRLHWFTWLAMLAVAAAGIWLHLVPCPIVWWPLLGVDGHSLGWPLTIAFVDPIPGGWGVAYAAFGAFAMNVSLFVALLVSVACSFEQLHPQVGRGVRWKLTDVLRWTAVAALILWARQSLGRDETDWMEDMTGWPSGGWAILHTGLEYLMPEHHYAPLYIRVPIVFAIACLIDTLLLAAAWLVRRVARFRSAAGPPRNEASA